MNDHSNVARKIAALVASGGPDVTPESARALAADLHQAARHAIEIVADVTGLASSVHTAGDDSGICVRPAWLGLRGCSVVYSHGARGRPQCSQCAQD